MKSFLVGIGVILAVSLAWQWRDWPTDPLAHPKASPPSSTAATPAADRTPELEALTTERLPGDYLTVAERPLFQPDRRPPAEESEPEPEPVPEEAVELVGVDVMAILIAEPHVPSVWLLDRRQAPSAQRYRLGDDYQGWRISAIEPDSIEFRRQGRSERLPLHDFSAAASPAQRSRPPGRPSRTSSSRRRPR